MFDKRMVRVSARQQWFWGAYDVTGDVVHWRAVPELTVNETIGFVEELKALRYPCRGVLTDLDTALTRAIEEVVFAGKSHQYCLKHAVAVLDRILSYKPQMRQRKRSQAKVRREFEQLPLCQGLYLVKAHQDFLQHWQRTLAGERLASWNICGIT